MAATFIIVTDSEIQTIVSRYISTKDGKNKNIVHLHCALQSVMTLAGAPGVFVSSVMPAAPIHIQGNRLRLKNISVVKNNLLAIKHTVSGDVAYFNYPDTIFYNFETLMVGVSNKIVTATTDITQFITQNSFVIPLLNHATIKETSIVFDVPEEYEINNNSSLFNIWLRNESGSGANDIENLLGVITTLLSLAGYELNAIAIKYGIYATFEVE